MLETTVRTADGRVFRGPLAAERIRRLYIGALHQHTPGYLEVAAATRYPDGKLREWTRMQSSHYLPGGAHPAAGHAWLQRVCDLVARHHDAGEECLFGISYRMRRQPKEVHVTATNWLWLDLDDPARLADLTTFATERPPHLVVRSGSGGAHVYWRLADPLIANPVDDDEQPILDERTLQPLEPIERALARISNAVGGDMAGINRDRTLRVPATVNYKTGDAWAQLEMCDFHTPPYTVQQLVGDLPDAPLPRSKQPAPVSPRRRFVPAGGDPYKDTISPRDYMRRLFGCETDADGYATCPIHKDGQERTPSLQIHDDPQRGFKCWGACDFAGSIYDAAAAKLGLPWGKALRGDDFKHARALIVDLYGDR